MAPVAVKSECPTRQVAFFSVIIRLPTVTDVFFIRIGNANSGVDILIRRKPMMPFGIQSESCNFSAVTAKPARSTPIFVFQARQNMVSALSERET